MTNGKPRQKKINLALQGGGSHGAFTWGVLDYLLEDGRFDFEGISATSAGSMNAVVMAAGFLDGGVEGARGHLKQFWHRVSEAGSVFCPAQVTTTENPFSGFFPKWMTMNDAHLQFLNVVAQNISPYQFNPLDINPLRDILDDMVDFGAIRRNKDFKLFVTATTVRTGAPRIFTTEELDRDMVMASAALPNVFQAVRIGDEAYWDGGYVGNPSLWPLFYETEGHDLLIVHVNALIRNDIPKDALSIDDRVNEITFNSAMLKEMRAIAFVQKLLHKDMLRDEYKDKYRDVFIHAIRAETAMAGFGMVTKFDTSWPLLTRLYDAGRGAAKDWVLNNFDKIGKESSVDLETDYLSVATDKRIKKTNKENKK